MSFVLRVNKDGAKYTPTQTARSIPVYMDEEKQKLLVGYVFEGKEDQALDCGWEDDPAALQAYDGSMILVSWTKERVVLCSDLIGCEKAYYYHRDHELLVSDDFWDIMREIKPEFDDLNVESAHRHPLLGGASLEGETIVKGLSIIRPANRVEYNIQANELRTEQYQYCHLSGEVTDIKTAAVHIGQAMDQTLKSIKAKYGDVVYGIGLSGGLDSRMVLHYAVKNDMKVHCFNICKKRPNGVLLARSVRLAQKIADLYSVPLTIVEWDPKQINAVKSAQTRCYPDGPMGQASVDIYKFIPSWEPDFDVMLTGGMGNAMMMFSLHFPEREKYDSENAATDYENIFVYNCFGSLTSKGMHVLLGTPIKEDTARYVWERELFSKDRPDIHRHLEDAAKDMPKAGLSYLEAVFNLGFETAFFMNCNGAFETMFGRRPAYTIYSSYVLKECLKCAPRLFSDRGLTRAVINENLFEAREIAEEGYSAAPAKINRFRFVRQCYAFVDRLIRGDGSHIANKYWRSPEVWKSFEEDMKNDCKWFWDIFGTDIPLDEVKRTTDIKMSTLWDTKRLLDALETKAYMDW